MPSRARFALTAALALIALAIAPTTAPAAAKSSATGVTDQVVPVDQLGTIPATAKMTVMPAKTFGLEGTGWVVVKLWCADLPAYSCKGTVLTVLPLEWMAGDKKVRVKQ
jgi:hypothetical protein